MKKSIYLSIYLSVTACTSLHASSSSHLPIESYDTKESSNFLYGHEEWIEETQTSSYHASGHTIRIISTVLIKALVEKNYDLALTLMTDQSSNKPTSKGLYPIHYVLKINPKEVSPGIISMLLDGLRRSGTDLNQVDDFFNTPLMTSIDPTLFQPNKEAFDYLIENLSPEQINAQSQGGWNIGATALLRATSITNQYSRYFVEKLIEKGANKDIRDERGRNAFDTARHPIIKEILRDNPPYSKELFDQVTNLVEQYHERNPQKAFDSISFNVTLYPREENTPQLANNLMGILTVYGKYLELKTIFYGLGRIISTPSTIPSYQTLIEQMKGWITSNYTPDAFSKIYNDILKNGTMGERQVFKNLPTQWPEFCGPSDTRI